MVPKHRVQLFAEQRTALEAIIAEGEASAHNVVHARILLMANETDNASADREIAATLKVSSRTVGRVRRRFVDGGIEAATQSKPTSRVYKRCLNPEKEAILDEIAEMLKMYGKRASSLRQAAKALVALGYAESISHETVRRIYKKHAEKKASAAAAKPG
jgi:transposase